MLLELLLIPAAVTAAGVGGRVKSSAGYILNGKSAYALAEKQFQYYQKKVELLVY